MQKNVWTMLITPLLLFGCSDSKQMKTLGENEFYIGERLASDSADADSTFLISGETGKMWHVDGNKVTAYTTDTDRI